jgi:uncharacterized membrane protein
MIKTPAEFAAVEVTIGHWIRFVGGGIEIIRVLVIVLGIIWSTYLFLHRRDAGPYYEAFKIRIGRSLLLGLEVLVAADIVKTIALDLTFLSLGLLAGLALVRTFLSWTLVLEIEGRWPWQRKRLWPSRARAFESIGERTAGSDVREYRPPYRRLSTQEPIGISTAGSVRGLIDPVRLHSTPSERV